MPSNLIRLRVIHRLLSCMAAASVPLVLTATAGAATPSIYVNYTASCSFSIVGDDGKAVTSVSPGSYQIVVATPFAFANDQAACEFVQFRMTGPGVAISTNLGTGDSETEQFSETLAANTTYTLQDDAQPAQTRRTFTTTATGSASTGGSSSGGSSSGGSSGSSSSGGKTSSSGSSTNVLGGTVVTTFRGTLDGTVNAAGKLTLTKSGKGVTTLKSGRYTFSIQDKTAKAGFTVGKIRTSAVPVTGVAFVGPKKASLVLTAGQWFFYSPSGKKSYFVVSA